MGLSGTGMTTATFTTQLGSQPVQDDFVALMPGGNVYTTENGCFAKTFGLTDPGVRADHLLCHHEAGRLSGVRFCRCRGQGRLLRRTDEYDAMVGRLKRERGEYLASFPGLDEAIIKSIG